MRDVGLKVGLLAGSTIIALVLGLMLGEVVLRHSKPEGFRAWTPHRRMTFRLPPGRAPGVGSPTEFTINGAGIRGDTFASNQRYRILAVGGSTTECLLLDDSLAWPHLLQRTLGPSVWVGNVGRSGLRAAHHLLHLEHLLPSYPHMDAVLVLVGVNDLQNRLGHDVPAPVDSAQMLQLAFDELPRRYRPGPSYKRTEVWRTLRVLKARLGAARGGGHAQDDTGDNLVTWRRHRQAAAHVRDSLPPLDSALAVYRRDLNAVIDVAAQFKTRIILVTQPAMWRAHLPSTLGEYLWLGGIGDFQAQEGKDYYSVAMLARGLERYNETLLEVCRARSVECVDAAAALPRDTTAFYDDVHFNESGSRKIAALLANYFTAETPQLAALHSATTPSVP